VAEAFMHEVRQEMARLSVLRGQVISFAPDQFDYHNPGGILTFLPRPQVQAEEVVLPDGVLDRVTRHVVGVGEHSDVLRAAGQHIKRGVLLYGPPGTGKTHLVRHLLSRTPGTTAVLLSGRTLPLLSEATTLARAAQPALIVLEDCDLVAEHRGGDTNAALFETLEAMDGLAADADITFILTTNRADLLERALVERPGRVDLAVEIAKPDLEGRQRLFALYGAHLVAAGQLSEDALATAAARTEGVTASFSKEAIRRTVINAAQEGRDPVDADLSDALDEMLSDAEALTRTLLGGEGGSLGSPGAGYGLDAAVRPGLYPAASRWSMSFDDDE
jgi:ATP-dependent 26S proteasome regulatory subunit